MHLNSTHGIGVVGANSNDIDIVGGAMSENGGSGVALGSGVDGVTVQGVRSGAFHGLNGNDYGIFFDSSLSNIRVLDNNFSGNDTADFAYSSLAGLEIRGNTGLVTENSGTGTITSGNTSVTVSHGLSVTPNAQDFSIVFTEQATNDYGRWWISNITSTQFDLNVSSDPGASNLDFSWNIKAWSL